MWAFSGVTNILELEVVVTLHCKCAKCHGIVHSETVDFVSCDFTSILKKGKELRTDSIEMCFILHEVTRKGMRDLRRHWKNNFLKTQGA